MHPIAERVKAANADLPRESVRVDAWGMDVLVWRINARERLSLEALAQAAGKSATPAQNLDVLVRTVALAVRDESYARVFTDDDLDLLRDTDPLALRQVFDAAARLNRMTTQSQDEAAASLGGRQGEGSPSA